jgi:hypothetical protein
MKTLLRNRIQKNSRLSILNTCLYEIVSFFQEIMHILIQGKISLIFFGGACWPSPLAISLGGICLNGYLSNLLFTPAAESHGLWPWMNAPTFGRDVAPHGRRLGATGFARGAPQWRGQNVCQSSPDE